MFLSCHVRVSEWIHTLYLPECQGTPCSKQARNLKFKWLQLDSPVWLNDWVFVYELSGCGFESSCSHLITKLFIKVQIWFAQSLGFKVQSSWLSTINSNPLLRVWFHPFDTLLSHFDFTHLLYFFILFYLRNPRIDVFVSVTYCFLASHSVSSSLPRRAFR